MSIFEGLMGNTSNLRVIKFLLPFIHAQFNEKDLMEEVGVSKPTMIKIIKKLVEFEMIVPTGKRGNSTYYRVNTSSPFIKMFENLDNLVIHYKYGDLMTDEVGELELHAERVKADPPTPF